MHTFPRPSLGLNTWKLPDCNTILAFTYIIQCWDDTGPNCQPVSHGTQAKEEDLFNNGRKTGQQYRLTKRWRVHLQSGRIFWGCVTCDRQYKIFTFHWLCNLRLQNMQFNSIFDLVIPLWEFIHRDKCYSM